MLRLVILLLFSITSIACQSVSEIYSVKLGAKENILLSEAYKVSDDLVGLCSRRRKRLKMQLSDPSKRPMSIVNEQNRVCRVFFRKWKIIPFAVLLITNDHEFLIGHPKPSSDFSFSEEHEQFGGIYYRNRTLAKSTIATQNINKVPTIVIGLPEHIDVKSSSEWVIVVMHEHFHQIQQSHPKYYKTAMKLKLSTDSPTSDWAKNYPFPYKDPFTQKLFQQKGHALNQAYQSKRKFDFRIYLQRRKDLQKLLKKKDRKFLRSQIWKNGVARFIEMEILDLLSHGYRPSNAFKSLENYEGFKIVKKRYEETLLLDLKYAALKERERRLFYSFGAAEASLLYHYTPNWLTKYFRHFFNLDPFFDSPELTN